MVRAHVCVRVRVHVCVHVRVRSRVEASRNPRDARLLIQTRHSFFQSIDQAKLEQKIAECAAAEDRSTNSDARRIDVSETNDLLESEETDDEKTETDLEVDFNFGPPSSEAEAEDASKGAVPAEDTAPKANAESKRRVLLTPDLPPSPRSRGADSPLLVNSNHGDGINVDLAGMVDGTALRVVSPTLNRKSSPSTLFPTSPPPPPPFFSSISSFVRRQ